MPTDGCSQLGLVCNCTLVQCINHDTAKLWTSTKWNSTLVDVQEGYCLNIYDFKNSIFLLCGFMFMGTFKS